MRKLTTTTILASVCVIGMIIAPVVSHAAKITIYRGFEKHTVDSAKRPANRVHLAKPTRATATVPQKPAAAPRTPAKPYWSVLGAGNTLWLRGKAGQLVACRVWSAGVVGKEVVRCTGRDAFGR